MKHTKQAFTLTELLIALGIIGAIAAISIPSLMTSINNRILTNQLKSTVGAIQQLMNDEMVTKNTKSLQDTDFAAPSKLIGTPTEPSTHFSTTRVCNTSELSQKECWKTTATGAAKVRYRGINGVDISISGPTYPSIVLKNGSIIGYLGGMNKPYGTNDKIIGGFCIDVNGNEPPNMRGRDYFCFYTTNKGKIADLDTPSETTANKIANCKNNGMANYCFGAIVDSGWKMPY